MASLTLTGGIGRFTWRVDLSSEFNSTYYTEAGITDSPVTYGSSSLSGNIIDSVSASSSGTRTYVTRTLSYATGTYTFYGYAHTPGSNKYYPAGSDTVTITAEQNNFIWDTNIYQGAALASYGGLPAPVTAVEWNRLVNAVNAKYGTSIARVSSGQIMNASSGGNVYQVANALGVPIPSGKRVTAQFFLNLEDAVNS